MKWTTLAVLLLTSGAAQAEEVPAIAVGPELKDRAPVLAAPIDEVTVYSDRARILRRARAVAKAGVNAFRLPDLPGAVFLDTVRVLAEGGRVIRAEASPVEREVVSIDQAKALIDQLEKTGDRIAELQIAVTVERRELERVQAVHPAPPVEEKDRDGRRALPISADDWFESIEFLSKRELAARARIQRTEAEIEELAEERERIAQQIDRMNLGAFTGRRVEVFVLVESPSARKVELSLEYFMPGARWKPAYDLRFDQSGRLTVETAAMVQQATGEDWSNVALLLSTAIPGQGIDLPELLTWTLGESRDFLPQPRAARAPPPPPRFAPPVPSPTRAEERRRIEIELLQMRFAQAMGRQPAGQPAVAGTGIPKPRPRPPSTIDFGDATISGGLAKSEGAELRSRRSVAPSAESVVITAAEDDGYAASGSQSYVHTPLALFEAARPAITFSDPYLPAVTSGGFDYVYEAPARATIPSTAADRRVPLAAQVFRAETYYEATPALDTTAYVKAKVKNGTGRPLLRGPTTIFVGGELVGQGELQTTGPGGEIGFPLGADENVRLVRTVVPTTEREGFISKDDVTTYATKIQIGNYKKRAITIEVIDQIPKTSHEDVEVKLLSSAPAALAEPDADGVMRWRITVPANQTRSIQFNYTIGRPADWQLYQQ